MLAKQVKEKLTCYHCGDDIIAEPILFKTHPFCCVGCKSVYELLDSHNLCDYYHIDEQAKGISIKNPVNKVKFNYLNDADIQKQLIQFSNNQISKITFHIPVMHCSSCIWLLESLYKLNQNITHSRVDFLKKQLSVTFNHNQLSLKDLVALLAEIGYEPAINLNSIQGKVNEKKNKRFYYQLGIAGFSFGNIMLISFPEYFGLDDFSKDYLSPLFGYLNMGLAIPVFLYSAQDYFTSAYKSLKAKVINIDFPLALGILVMFIRSSYEVVTHTGLGFFDTLTGLVFLLLIGKWAQQYTIDTFSFERDYKSYFPVAVTTVDAENNQTTVAVNKLKIGDRMLVHHNEIIPADAMLINGDAQIDFSFVTGESEPVVKVLGEMIYAGGRQTGGTLLLEVCKPVSQSYLTQLWNSEQYKKAEQSKFNSFQTRVSKHFTIALLAIAISSGIFWLVYNPALSLNAFTAVLIIACPCALALSSPFALGNAMRMLGRSKFYLKSAQVVEQMAGINQFVFDKTGTITQPSEGSISFVGKTLSIEEKELVYAVTKNSVHPLSKKISNFLFEHHNHLLVNNYSETGGLGIEAHVKGNHIKVGSAKMMQLQSHIDLFSTAVYVSINNNVLGYFKITHTYRNNLNLTIKKLAEYGHIHLLSGDNNNEQENLKPVFNNNMLFKQTPADKMLFIDNLKNNNNKVAMIGDGLNDAGALKVADIGISVTENTAHFTPGSDVIMDATMFNKLPDFFKYSKKTMQIIKLNFVLSLCYNIVGLYFAVQGTLSPLFAAILMPISSITVIVVTTLGTYLVAKKLILNP